MGALPFSDLFKTKGAGGRGSKGGHRTSVGNSEKLAIVEGLEEAGVSWFWATDPSGKITYLSPTIVERFETDIDDLIGEPLQSLFVPSGGETDGRSLGLKLGSRKSFSNLTVEAINKNVDLVLRLSGQPLNKSGGSFDGFRGVAIDVTAEVRMEEEAERLAQFDTLTGLANRHRMEMRISSTLQAFRNAERACALLMLDLDRFKQVNDTLGHAAGDQMLQQVAERLKSAVQGQGEIGRLGGDEFQVLIPDVDDRGELGEVAKRIIAMLSQPYSLTDGRATIGCSVGIAIAPYDGLERDELTRAADLALYASKNGGRGQFRFYASDLEHEANLRKRMEEDLAQAIDDEHFILEYQPIVSLEGNRVVGLEARYCWDDPERGRVAPETFLPVAEGSRLIVPIGEWGLIKACKTAQTWPDPMRLSIKITPVQFAATGFADLVENTLKSSGLPSARLELLLNETILQGDSATVDKTLAALFKLGVRLTLDEFGSGLSSLNYLRRAPFSALNVGSAYFEPTVGDEFGDMKMIGAITTLAGAMGMETGASGIHAIELLDKLRAHGITTIQGFVFSDAISQQEVAEALERGDWTLMPTNDGSQRASRRTVFRKIGIIHEDHYYDVTLRNLSRSGAMIQGLENVPVGTAFVLDFGGGQLAVASVKRTMDDTQGVEFEQELVDDGAGGLCTRNRVSPYELAAAGAPLEALSPGKYNMETQAPRPSSYAQFKLSGNAPEQTGRQAA
ncbi:EAL domain-containing protein [Erythrobacter sp. W53]|uniref:sensor domain-containing protein n=1 Tax=Erythrobacteraceae TaxID=335929 RepID=UPI0036D422A5